MKSFCSYILIICGMCNIKMAEKIAKCFFNNVQHQWFSIIPLKRSFSGFKTFWTYFMLPTETTVFLNLEWSCSVTESHWLRDSADPVLVVTEFLGCPVRADVPAHSHAFPPSDREPSCIISFLLQELVFPHQIWWVKDAQDDYGHC